MAIFLAIFGLFESSPLNKRVQAASTDITINELMYNPLSDDGNDEFLELYNNSPDAQDISGWCFTDGIDYCFPNSTTITGNSYLVLSPSTSQSLATYGITVSHVYSGGLKNSGEKLELKDSNSNLIDTVTYSDSNPWPVSPDGTGPSLELKGPNLDNNQATSWGASLVNDGTPGTENSLTSADLPILTNLSTPSNTSSLETIQPTDSPTITVSASNVTTVNLVYKVMFETEVTVAMNDNGTGADVTAGDNIFSVNIPTQTAGSLVRYKVTASNTSSYVSLPGTDDTVGYKGYVVRDISQEGGSTPRLQWYISDDNYNSLIHNPNQDDTYYYAVIAYGNEVIDNTKVRLKGESSRSYSKKPLKFKLPKGYSLEMPGILDFPLGEFHLNSEFADDRYVVSLLSWRIFKLAGFPVPQVVKVQLQRNGSFEGAYTLAEKYEKEWLDRNQDYKTAEIYEDQYEKVQPDDDDLSRIEGLRNALDTKTGEDKRNFLINKVDIASAINLMAAEAVSRSHDWSSESNLFSIYNSSSRERWSYLPWDLDLSMNFNISPNGIPQGYGDMISPYDTAPYILTSQRYVFTAIWDDPVLQSMYKRRVRTLVDEVYGSGDIQRWADEEITTALTAAELDGQKWYTQQYEERIQPTRDYISNILGLNPDDPLVLQGALDSATGGGIALSDLPDMHDSYKPYSVANKFFILKYALNKQGDKFLTDYVNRGLIPNVQNANANVKINGIVSRSNGNSSYQYIELYNPTSEAVDITGWSVRGLTKKFPGGSVVPAHGYAYAVNNDIGFKDDSNSGKIVFFEYNQVLSPESSEISLQRKNGSVSDSYPLIAIGSNPTPWADKIVNTHTNIDNFVDRDLNSSEFSKRGDTGDIKDFDLNDNSEAKFNNVDNMNNNAIIFVILSGLLGLLSLVLMLKYMQHRGNHDSRF